MAEELKAEVLDQESRPSPADPFEGWDDDSTEDIEIAEETEEAPVESEEANKEDVAEADQPTDNTVVNEQTNEQPETVETDEQPAPSDQKYTLKHLDETKEVTLDEMQSMAQMGWDYPRIRQERDELKAQVAKLQFDIDKLNQIKGDFASYEDLIDNALAQKLVEAEANNGRVVSEEEALRRVKADRETNTPKVKSFEDVKQESIAAFAQTYPTLDPATIPQSVWAEFNETGDLIAAYRRVEAKNEADAKAALAKENETLKAEIETLKQNIKNKERSTGSQKSAGANQQKDPDFEGWNDD